MANTLRRILDILVPRLTLSHLIPFEGTLLLLVLFRSKSKVMVLLSATFLLWVDRRGALYE